jgi:hypothetical protein
MAGFLVQTVEGHVKHDFAFSLEEAVRYQNWYNNGSHALHLCDNVLDRDFSTFIPVGTIQFVKKFLSIYYDIHVIKPINIPPELFYFKFLQRHVELVHKKDLVLDGKEKFVKSNESLKGYTETVTSTEGIPDIELVVSDLIEIESEWRAFVFRGELVGLQNYSGDFTAFPDVEFIKICIKEYTNCPPAYTLDIGLNEEDGTFIIEAHNFYSCGLYGFSENRLLPQMFISSFNHLIKNQW